MTLVTTSRRPGQTARTCAKELAFAIGCRYMSRGKSGIKDILEQDSFFILISQQKRELRMQIFDHDKLITDYIITDYKVRTRDHGIRKGLFTSDKTLSGLLEKYIQINLIDSDDSVIEYDGRQKKEYILSIAKNETHSGISD